MRGREVALTPPPGFRLPPLGGLAEDVTAEPDEIVELQATYHDTTDLRLTRAGVRLFRQDGTWTVILPEPVGGEHRFADESGEPPRAALDLVRAYTRDVVVAPVARLKTRRHRVRLHNGGTGPVAEVDDDEVTVLDGTRITARFRELDVTVDAAAPAPLADALLDRLHAAGAGPAPQHSPLARALGPRALVPPDAAVPPPLRADATTTAAVRAALARSVAQLVAYDAGVRFGEDPEAVHQARVATRRLRSDLRTFRSLLEPTWVRSLRDELRWIGDLLGGVRDADVMRELLEREARELPRAERPIGDELLSDLALRRHTARLTMLEGMRSARYARLLDRLVDAAHRPAVRPDAEGPAVEQLPPLVRGPWRHLDQAVGVLPDDPPDAALHDIRVRAKRLRYAAEAVAPLASDRVARLARRAADLQDVLGRHQDAVVAGTWLREISRNAGTRPEVFTAGALTGLLRAEELAARAAWPRAWRRLARAAERALR